MNEQEQKLRDEWEKLYYGNAQFTGETLVDWWLNQIELARGQGILAVKEGTTPMGASQWQNHGAKHGYDKYFDDRLREARAEEREKVHKGYAPYIDHKSTCEKDIYPDTDCNCGLDSIVRNISQDKQ